MIVVWQEPQDALPQASADALRLLAAQAAVAIEQASVRSRGTSPPTVAAGAVVAS